MTRSTASEALTQEEPASTIEGQSRSMSLVETMASTAIGYAVALVTQILVFPIFGVDIPLRDNIGISLIFTAVSIARGYLIRRFFNSAQGRK